MRQISQEREARRSGVSQRSPSAVRVSTEAERVERGWWEDVGREAFLG